MKNLKDDSLKKNDNTNNQTKQKTTNSKKLDSISNKSKSSTGANKSNAPKSSTGVSKNNAPKSTQNIKVNQLTANTSDNIKVNKKNVKKISNNKLAKNISVENKNDVIKENITEDNLNTQPTIKHKRKRTKFEDLSKFNKIFTIVNLSLNAILLGLCLALIIVFGINGDPDNRMLSCIFMFTLALIPYLAEIIFRFRFNPTVYLFYIIYIYVAGLWGSCLNGYSNIWWLDIAIHFFFGYVGGLIALLFLCKTKEISKLKLLSIIIICFSISMACGAMWEIAEFIGDTMFNQTAQGFPINGITAVTDTMEDIVCNFGGAVLFCIHYILYKITNKNLGMGYIENDFNSKI